jgi:transposase
MKKNQIIIGIDVSKSKLDCYIQSVRQHFVVENNSRGFKKILETVIKLTKSEREDLLICFENTGKYSKMLSVFLATQKISFVMASSLEIKRSLGITRGKNDKIDSVRIANYAYEKREKLSPTVLPGAVIDRIKSLLTLREKLIKHRTAYKNGLSDLHDCYKKGETNVIREVQQRLIKAINEEIKKVEAEIEAEIKSDASIKRNYELILTVRAIGKIVGYYLIAYTENFTSFIDARSFACYSGIAPFANSSGTVTGRSRVHPFANKQLKSLLNMAAMAAMKIKGEYREYYNRRVEAGKNKMSTLNIIRNKIVFRAFAVVKRGSPYVDLNKFAA